MKHLIAFLALLFLYACSTSNQVVSDSFLQKRKYRKGWHVNKAPNYDLSHSSAKSTIEGQATTYDESDTLILSSSHDLKEVASVDKKERFAIDNASDKKNWITQSIKPEKSKSILSSSFLKNKNNQSLTVSHDLILNSDSQLNDPWLSEKAVQIILAILALLVLIFTGITPLAVWISVGPGPALKTNLTLYVAFLLSALIAIMIIVFTLFYAATGASVSTLIVAAVFGVLAAILGIVAYIHALVSIIRGF